MAEKLEYDADLFYAAADATGRARDRVNGIISRLVSAADGRGAPWGADTIGQSFANGQDGTGGYLLSSSNLVTGSRNVAGSLDSFSAGQRESARLLERMEQGNVTGFS
ncbi:hypothetical protein [Nocardia sp. NPDC057227]|uniref:hypothetical protein n=1 Tax=Nocardia sp. NPDC057227 TaxID=3346056 RepID=UPI003625C990